MGLIHIQSDSRMQDQRLVLASHVAACIDMGVLVLMDLRADCFSCARLVTLGALPALVGGLPEHTDWPTGGDAHARASSSARDLARRGLIVRGGGPQKPMSRIEPVDASAFGDGDRQMSFEESRPMLWEAMQACQGALMDLTFSSLQHIFTREAAYARHARAAQEAAGIASDPHEDAMVQAVRAFEAARLWFPKNRVCLFDSLALLRFLRGRNYAARWVFGVRTHPFEAHCWVQSGRIALNDTPDHVRGFSVIAST